MKIDSVVFAPFRHRKCICESRWLSGGVTSDWRFRDGHPGAGSSVGAMPRPGAWRGAVITSPPCAALHVSSFRNAAHRESSKVWFHTTI